MKIEYYAMTAKGTRERQEDALVCRTELSFGETAAELSGSCTASDDAPAAFWVFDGLGGLFDGNVAAQTAAETAAGQSPQHGAIEHLLAVTHSAHQQILDKMLAMRPMGCTAAGVVFAGDAVYAANIGDSRIYCLGVGAGLTEVSRDDTVLIDGRRLLTQYLGKEVTWSALTPNISVCASGSSLRELLLCTDGLYAGIPEESLCRLMEDSTVSVAEKCRMLMEQATQASSDNITIILIRLLPETGDAA